MTTTPAGQFLPGAALRLISYRTEAGLFTTSPIGWILHVVVGNGSPYWTFENAVSPGRRSSHGWVAKDGSSEQYAELGNKSWSQAAGNDNYYAFETEGFPNEPLTSAQIHTLGVWHNFVRTVDFLANADGQQGVGTHYMGGACWGGHTCPDPSPGGQGPRSHQRDAVIQLAINLRKGNVVPPIAKIPHDPALVKRVQTAVRVNADGVLGVLTLTAVGSVVTKNLNNVKYLQERVGTTQDGSWGSISEQHRISTVVNIQSAIGVAADGNWGPISKTKWAAVVRANYV